MKNISSSPRCEWNGHCVLPAGSTVRLYPSCRAPMRSLIWPRLEVYLPFSSTSSNTTSSRFIRGFGIAHLREFRECAHLSKIANASVASVRLHARVMAVAACGLRDDGTVVESVGENLVREDDRRDRQR